uniref:Uncharacterized protein n=1 Tax=Curvibacter symbiont subsp. Hydra magnipapillata TaxID=667019 RepID=C9YBY3_CURXX|nr:hypothetical protein Csp_C22120 [Curvibacter putative symbiont of Hydra magnipapillata]
MTGALPDTLEQFFDTSSRSFDRLYRPAWLLNDLADPVWHIKFGENIRKVEGVVKGAARIRWALRLPDGRLTDRSHNRLLEHAKLLLVAAFDGATSSSKTLAIVATYHRHLMWLVEYWVTHGPGLHQQQGLLGLDVDTVETFVAIYAMNGVAGISRACKRWDEWVVERLQDEALQIDAAIEVMSSEERARLRIGLGAVRNTSAESLHAKSDSFDEGHYVSARVLLHRMHAYDLRGVVRGKFIEEAIGVEASRIPRIAALLVHLQRYEICHDYSYRAIPRCGYRTEPLLGRLSLAERAEKPLKVWGVLNWVRQASQTLTLIPELASNTFADPTEVGERLARFNARREGRTKSIPTPIALQLTTFCIDWMQHVEPQLRGLVEMVFESLSRNSEAGPSELQRLLEGIPVPAALRRFGARRFWGRSLWKDRHGCNVDRGEEQKTELAITDLLNVHVAVCFVLVAMLSCCRRSEVLTLSKDAIQYRGGRAYIRVLLRKTGADEARLSVLKPVPMIVSRCFESLSAITAVLNRYRPTRDAHVASLVFRKFNRNGLSEIAQTIYAHLDLVSEVANLRTDDKRLWHIRPHELRRFFALSFFHDGGRENSLPALSWFMGHREIHMTWRYVREELSGAELSEAEAALAAAAVYSDDEAASVQRLRRMLLKHFGVEELKVLSEAVVQEYLEMLHESGTFTATPVQVRGMSGMRFTVLITIHRH